jgi:probable phosphoglycerate mutase
MKTVIFARHGEAEANQAGLLAGAKTNSPLTTAGREHAGVLARLLVDNRIDLIVTSPLSRASETAEIVARDLSYGGKIVVEPLFIERDFGNATDLPKMEAFAMLDSGTAVGAESIADFGERARQALEWLMGRPEKQILVVSHAAFGQMLGTIANGGKPEEFLSFDSLSNGSIFELTLE